MSRSRFATAWLLGFCLLMPAMPATAQEVPCNFAESQSSCAPEIRELARALRYDVDLIYEFVHNEIDHRIGRGHTKGPLGTLLDGNGNSFDIASLMVELLRVSGIPATFMYGRIKLNSAQLQNWLGVNAQAGTVSRLLTAVGVGKSAYQWNAITGEIVSVTFLHAWVKVPIGGTQYVFDPSFKSYEYFDGIDVAAAMSYDRSSFLATATAGATVTANSILGLNRSGIHSTLQGLSSNFVDSVRSNHFHDTLEGVIGGRRIVPVSGPVRQTSLPYQDSIVPGGDGYFNGLILPTNFLTLVRIQLAGLDFTLASAGVYGRRLSIVYNASGQAMIKLDSDVVGGQLGNPAPIGSEQDLTITVTHPYFATAWDRTSTRRLVVGGHYALMNGWDGSGREMIERHRNRLQFLRRAAFPFSDDSEPVMDASLWVMAATYLADREAYRRISNSLSHVKTVQHHTLGVVGYDGTSYLFDIATSTVSHTALDVEPDPDAPAQVVVNIDDDGSGTLQLNISPPSGLEGGIASEQASFADHGGMGSGFESGVIEHIMNEGAVSTVDLLDQSVAESLPIFVIDSSNSSAIIPQLVNYDAADLAEIQTHIGLGQIVLAPQRGDLQNGDWQGAGYQAYDPMFQSSAWKISGGLNGGYLRIGTHRNFGVPFTSSFSTPAVFRPARQSSDPIDLFTGHFLYQHRDIVVGDQSGLPFGLGLDRTYRSGQTYSDGLLGRGWTHNFNISAVPDSDPFQGFGEDSPIDAAAAIVTSFVVQDILTDDRSPVRILFSSLAHQWLIDQIRQNAVFLTLPDQSQKFVRLPDGSFNPPPGSASELTSQGNGFLLRLRDGAELTFDADGKVTQWVDPHDVTLAFTYSAGNLASVSNGLGRALTFSYQDGRISQVSDGTGRSIQYSYDPLGNLSAFTDPLGNVTNYSYLSSNLWKVFNPANPTVPEVTNSYDVFGRVKVQTSARGFDYEYFFAGARSQETDPLGNELTLYYNERGKVTREIDQEGNVTSHEYDGQDRLVKTVLPEGNGVEFTYDQAHNPLTVTRNPKPGSGETPLIESFTYEPTFNKVTSKTDALGRVTEFDIDPANGDLLRIDAPEVDGQTPSTVMTHNALGLVSTVTDPEGKVTHNSYDTNGDLLSATEDDDGLSLTTAYTYDAVGNRLTTTDPRGNVTTNEYDATRRITKTTAPAPFGFETSFVYDEDGRLLETRRDTGDAVNPLQVVGQSYDVAGNRISITDPSGNVTSFEYDELDRMSKRIDAELRETEFVYDPVGRLQMTIDALGQTAEENSYSANGLRIELADANNNATTFEYDGHDRLERTVFPDGSFEQIAYDAAGNVTERTTRAGAVISASYDALDRLETRTLPTVGGAVVEDYQYDLTGRLSEVSDGTVTLQRAYDTAGRMVSEGQSGRTVQFAYDAAGNRTRITWPDGYFVDYSYDTLDRPDQVLENGTGLLVDYDYDALSRRVEASFGNGVTTTLAYALNDDLELVGHSFPGAATDDFGYGYDTVGAPTSRDFSNIAYMYVPPDEEETDYSANLLNQYADVGGTLFGNDANGNLTSDGTNSYTYDALSRLVGAQTASLTIDYTYDPLGRRITKTVGAVVTQHLYLGAQEIAEYDGSGNLQQRFVPGPAFGEVIATVSVTGTRVYHHQDLVGSTVARTNDSGLVIERNAYGPFGEETAPSSSPFRFTGQRFDAETGLYHFRARVYSVAFGRFLQPDPAGYLDGPNLYAYASNSPLRFTDPTGLGRSLTTSDFDLTSPSRSSGSTFTLNDLVDYAEFRSGRTNSTVGPAEFISGIGSLVRVAVGFTVRAAVGSAIVTDTARILENAIRGRGSEARILREFGLTRNTTAVLTAEGRSIPDALTDALSVEVKDAARVSLTRQLRIQTKAAAAAGRESVLITGNNTCVSGTCLAAFDQAIRRADLGPR